MADRVRGTPGRETSLGGKGQAFPSTMWGMVSRIRGTNSTEQREGLEELSRRYWKPIYRYVRIAWAKSNEDAKDLTQAFLVWLIEGEPLQKYEEERGKLRTYLKVLLKGFVRDRQKAMQRLKRGGHVKIIDLDADTHALKEVISDPDATDPGKAFDRSWAIEVSQRAVNTIRERLKKDGKEIPFQVFEMYDLDKSKDNPTYKKIAGELGIKETDVHNHLGMVREEVRREIRKELFDTVATESEMEEEWRELFGA